MPQNITTWGHRLKLLKKFCKANVRQNYFSNRVVNTWNKLPSSIVNAPSLNSFKAMLDNLWKEYKYCGIKINVYKEHPTGLRPNILAEKILLLLNLVIPMYSFNNLNLNIFNKFLLSSLV